MYGYSSWIHEIIPMEVAKFKGYYLSDVASKRANITFVASNLLGTEKPYKNKSTNAGGWADSTLNTWLNTRMVKAISPLWKALIKPEKYTLLLVINLMTLLYLIADSMFHLCT